MSRDIKSFDINGVNDGLERAIERLRQQLRTEISLSERKALSEASATVKKEIEELKKEQQYSIDQKELEKRIEAIQSDLGAQIDESARAFNERLAKSETAYAQALQDLSDSIHSSMEEQNKAFAEQLDTIYSTFEDQQEQIDMLNLGLEELSTNFSQLQEDINERFDMQQEQIETLQEGVSTLFELRENDKNNKILAAGRALALLETVRGRKIVDRFATQESLDRVKHLEEELKNIRTNPDQYTISDANTLVRETLVMEKMALREQAKWLAKQKMAKTMVETLLHLMQDSMQLKATSIYDETMVEELQTDYWTHGRFHRLDEEVKKVKEEIDSEEANMERLDSLMQKMKEMQQQLEALREEAVQLGILSESRILITKEIQKAMTDQGWECIQGGCMGGEDEEDDREGTFLMLRDPANHDELSIMIIPEEKGGKTINKIVVHRNSSKTESEKAFRNRMAIIKREIEKSGHKLGEIEVPPCGGDGQIEQVKDATEMKRKGAAKKLRQRMNAQQQ